ncbi:MAG: hypothetical protein NT062_22855, partial [Proteobacteria bacterium]|nr:hypothetical protein [Pseudomonadota bacterium]
MRRALLLTIAAIPAIPGLARADEIPTITITEAGPDQEVPVGRSFDVAGAAAGATLAAQVVVVRKGESRLLGSDGPDCATLQRQLRIDATARSAADDGDDDADMPAAPVDLPTLRVGRHRAFELFDRAEVGVRDAQVLVSTPWRRTSDTERQYRVPIPGDRSFFATGYGFCLFVVTSDHAQLADDHAITDAIDGLGKKLVDCADQASCDEDALDEYETRFARILARARGPVNGGNLLAARLKEAARVELGTATGLVEARDRFDDQWHANASVMQPATNPPVWLDPARDAFARALTALLARSAALLPQVTTKGVTLYTTDGKLPVGAIQLLDDGRTIRVASSPAPGGNSRVLDTTTDALQVADGIAVFDLVQLGLGKLRVDQGSQATYLTFEQIGQRIASLGLDDWTADDAAFL